MTTLPICQQLRDPGQAVMVADHAADVIEDAYMALIKARLAVQLWAPSPTEPLADIDAALEHIDPEGRSP